MSTKIIRLIICLIFMSNCSNPQSSLEVLKDSNFNQKWDQKTDSILNACIKANNGAAYLTLSNSVDFDLRVRLIHKLTEKKGGKFKFKGLQIREVSQMGTPNFYSASVKFDSEDSVFKYRYFHSGDNLRLVDSSYFEDSILDKIPVNNECCVYKYETHHMTSKYYTKLTVDEKGFYQLFMCFEYGL